MTDHTEMSPLSFKIAFMVCATIALINATMVGFGLWFTTGKPVWETHLPSYVLGAALWGGLAAAIFMLHRIAIAFIAVILVRKGFGLWQIYNANHEAEMLFGSSVALFSIVSLAIVIFVAEFVVKAWRRGYLV
ncbi:hypothetical protein TRP8649_01215 [Pelagimonas phthalicica]|uniref:Uncharacterized protein n=1 Tax=Pelagimonas phthalicica TaxID=1037362 RepID=A0A238J9U1_9RHOB|nr:hypothetical protein [Pelagimonas phthalicica]TDS94360.1 hypothetical protein CLV87_0857 [Pelagimonas phthalicica]SMX27113.1 hypothetical protein TRP8649_01215 [Pelagimonas phthalicica]